MEHNQQGILVTCTKWEWSANAGYIFFSIILDQRGYSEKSEFYDRLRFIFLSMFNIFGPI